MPRARKPRVPGQAPDPRGGPRQGQQGRSYPNRSDLQAQPVRTAKGQAYGQAGQQAAAQRAVPLAQTPPVPTGQGQPLPAPPIYADDVPTPGQPTRRPNEPLTAGMSVGPGAGPSQPQGPPDVLGDRLRALYRAYPTQELRELLEDYAIGD